MRKLWLASLLLCASLMVDAQNVELYKQTVKALSSSKYQGRGYALGGANKAGRYLERAYRRAGVDEVVRQPFTLDINTFPAKMKMSVDRGRNRDGGPGSLTAGRDFTLREFSPGAKGNYPLYFVDTLNYNSEKLFHDLEQPLNKGAMVVCDFWFSYKHKDDFARLQLGGGAPNAGLIYTWNEPLKFYKAYGEKVIDKPVFWVLDDCIKGGKSVSVNVDNKFYKDYECFNVIAKVAGERSDSCFMFTAHYDHLGNLGRRVYYPGANDNASGSAALVTLAEYFSQHRPKFDVYFVAFSGEDANLRGSTWFVNHPVVPLERIKYLFNIDMIGDNNRVLYCETSDAGLPGFQKFQAINARKGYFETLNRGKLAANSDHYPFAERQVPCIFFMNEKGDAFQYYHTPQDDWQHAIFDSYEPVFRLVVDFIASEAY